jgi:hypothetical protein
MDIAKAAKQFQDQSKEPKDIHAIEEQRATEPAELR